MAGDRPFFGDLPVASGCFVAHVAIPGGNMARDLQPSRRRNRVFAAFVAALALGGTALTEIPVSAAAKPRGHDVSSHQKKVDWSSAKSKGARFVYVKAT